MRSESLMDGYYRDPEATAAAVVDGWLATGDLGYLAEGTLFVTGRKKEIIIRGGQTILPSAIEEVVAEDPDVRAGCVAAVGMYAPDQHTELVWVVCETRVDVGEHAALVARIRQRLRGRGMSADRVIPVEPGTLPKTTSGKIRRSALRAALAGADRDVAAALRRAS